MTEKERSQVRTRVMMGILKVGNMLKGSQQVVGTTRNLAQIHMKGLEAVGSRIFLLDLIEVRDFLDRWWQKEIHRRVGERDLLALGGRRGEILLEPGEGELEMDVHHRQEPWGSHSHRAAPLDRQELVPGGLEMALSCEKVAALPSACTNLDAATALVCNGAAAYKLVSVWNDK